MSVFDSEYPSLLRRRFLIARLLTNLASARSPHPDGASNPQSSPDRPATPTLFRPQARAMSWLARSIAATLSSPRGEPDPDADEAEPEPASAGSGAGPGEEESSPRGLGASRDPGAEEPEQQPCTPSRGVKGDISELTETLTRRLWGVASFLAPPPEVSTPRAGAAAPAEGEEDEEVGDGGADGVEEEEEAEALSPRIAGIRSDLAEIGGRVRSGFSMLQNNLAVAEISKIASSLLPFGQGDANEGEPVPGITEEVVVFVRHISTRPETWLDFPLFISERYADGNN